MRFQGRITEWKDDRGFGFITPNGGGAKVFLHFRSLQKGEPRPGGGELVTYEVVAVNGKGPRAENTAYVDRTHATQLHGTRDARLAPRRERRRVSTLIGVALVIAIAAFGWQKYSALRHAYQFGSQLEESGTQPSTPRPQSLTEQVGPVSAFGHFKCEGKRYCSQMTSCNEAKFYLKNCPGVEIDGDGDGIPCERQWCNQ